jgi:undecaprenyl diphosphate synthase
VLHSKIPQHVAIVMDGNGRWAENRGLARIEGHKAGVNTVKKITRACMEKKIACLSLFAFSSENWSRPKEEVSFLMELFLHALKEEVPELNQHGIRIVFTGDRTPLMPILQQQMQAAETLTKSNKEFTLNVLLNYGGKWDIVNAAKKMAQAAIKGELYLDTIDETTFANFLGTANLTAPDLFIRTSGELRLSNFYLWQLAYTELYFTDKHWPDFDEQEFELALDSFAKRNRRFGHVAPVA